MKKILISAIFLLFFHQLLFSATYHITTTASLTYSPDFVIARIGDVITIDASSFHPLVQVSKDTWEAKDATPLPGGWGTKTSTYTFTVTKSDTIYFVCATHVGLGMRGRIAVQSVAGVDELTAGLNNINISPNPVTSQSLININSGSELLNINVYDEMGNLVENIPTNQVNPDNRQFILDATSLGSGIYMMIVTTNDGILTRKLIIAK